MLPERERRPTSAGRAPRRSSPLGRGLALAFHLPRDAVHGLNRLERVLAHRRLGREHDGVGAVQDGVGHVGRLGPGRPRSVNHRLEHLRRGDDRLAVQAPPRE